MSHYVLTRRRSQGLGASPFDPILEQVERVVKRQTDRVIDVVGERADRYLESPKGEALLDKFESKVEEALVNVAYKRKSDIALLAVSIAAMSVVGISLGSKVGKTGVKVAAGIALASALPLLLAGPPEAKAPAAPTPDEPSSTPKKVARRK